MKKDDVEVGTPVIYWEVIKQNGERDKPLKTEIISSPWELGHGEVVCKVKGKSGGVSIKHLDLITPGSLMAAKIQGLAEITDDDFQKAAEDYLGRLRNNVVVKWGEE